MKYCSKNISFYFSLIIIAIAKKIIIIPTAINNILIIELALKPEELVEIPTACSCEYASAKGSSGSAVFSSSGAPFKYSSATQLSSVTLLSVQFSS